MRSLRSWRYCGAREIKVWRRSREENGEENVDIDIDFDIGIDIDIDIDIDFDIDIDIDIDFDSDIDIDIKSHVYSSITHSDLNQQQIDSRWTSDLEILKKFVEETIQQHGKWSSPGGATKSFKSDNNRLTITWYGGKQSTLVFQGKDGPSLKEHLVNFIQRKEAQKPNYTNNQSKIQNNASSAFWDKM